jgi:HEAT repeat protein
MAFQSRAQWMRLAVLATGILAFAPIDARLIAQTQTRQVSAESLIYDLKHPDPVRRQAAARALGIARYLPATPHLVALAHDPVAVVRREVELSLECMDDIQALPGFVAFASDSESDIRSRAVASLVNMHVPRASGVGAALTKVVDLFVSPSAQDSELVVEPDVPVDPVVVETLRARIVDPERRIRRTAIRGLGILRAKAAIPDLVQVVREDRDDGLRFEAVRAVRKIGDASVGEHFVPLLNVNNDGVRNELITTLGSMRYRGAVPELTRIVEQTKRVDLPCVLALSALADIADPSSAALFERFKADKNEILRLYANEGIARAADSSMKTAISAARLAEKSPRVRTAQAFALLRIGEAEYLDELIRALERSTTRDLAKEFLLETRPADRPALFAPRPANSTARAGLADVLGLLGDPDAMPRLQELAHDPDGNVARAAERAVRRISVVSSQ